MEADRFDSLARSLTQTGSRRRALTALGGLVTLNALPASAKKGKNKKKAKKPSRNAFGCLDVGTSCRGSSANCCSGTCEGKKPKKGKKDTSSCVAHNTGICSAETDTCTVGVGVPCHPSNPNCLCFLTTGNAGFCGSFTGNGSGGINECRVCRTDPECQAEFGAGAACVVLGGVCTPFCLTTGRTACAVPCA
jgi:hypothetical protein